MKSFLAAAVLLATTALGVGHSAAQTGTSIYNPNSATYVQEMANAIRNRATNYLAVLSEKREHFWQINGK